MVPFPRPSHLDHLLNINHPLGIVLKALYAFNHHNKAWEMNAEITDFTQKVVVTRRGSVTCPNHTTIKLDIGIPTPDCLAPEHMKLGSLHKLL